VPHNPGYMPILADNATITVAVVVVVMMMRRVRTDHAN
jgi:hypothetical protein